MLPDGFLSDIICAGRPGEIDGACHGDSGGPLVQFKDTLYPHQQQIGNEDKPRYNMYFICDLV